VLINYVNPWESRLKWAFTTVYHVETENHLQATTETPCVPQLNWEHPQIEKNRTQTVKRVLIKTWNYYKHLVPSFFLGRNDWESLFCNFLIILWALCNSFYIFCLPVAFHSTVIFHRYLETHLVLPVQTTPVSLQSHINIQGVAMLAGDENGDTDEADNNNTQQSTMEINSFFNLVEKYGPYICWNIEWNGYCTSIEHKFIEKRRSSRLWETWKSYQACNIPSFFLSPALLPSWNIIAVESDSNHSTKNLLQISRDLLRDLHFMKPGVKNFYVWKETQDQDVD